MILEMSYDRSWNMCLDNYDPTVTGKIFTVGQKWPTVFEKIGPGYKL